MKAIRLTMASLIFVVVSAYTALAQNNRSFVSGLGSDFNPCTRTAPCRTFGTAISQTNARGEVVALDSAGYGTFTVTTSLTVEAPPGVYAGVTATGASVAININAGPSDTVILRGLTVNSENIIGNGIQSPNGTGTALFVENCIVTGFNDCCNSGLFFVGPGTLEVKDSIFRGNHTGINVLTLSGTTALATIDHVHIEGTGSAMNVGLEVGDGVTATVRSSLASLNGTGFLAASSSSAVGELNIENCVVSNNMIGVAAQSTSTGVAKARVSNSAVTNNTVFGLRNFGSPAVILSRANNTVEGNGMDTGGPIGSYTAK
jgi:hypothetical protein